MLLTPFECAIIMSVVEKKPVSIRRIYYLVNERYELLGLKVGKSIRINEDQIKEYYEFRKFPVRENIDELAGYFKRGRNSGVLNGEQDDCLPIDFIEAVRRVQSRHRARVEYKKKRFKNIYFKKRNIKQLEFFCE